MSGWILLTIAWITSLLALGAYGPAFTRQNMYLVRGRKAFQVMTIALTGACAVLLYLFFTHQFQYAYVHNYSSTDLPWYYLLSAFWAGQEGTYLLWAWLGGMVGIALIRYEQEEEAPVMALLALVQLFLLTLTLVQSPFAQLQLNPGAGSGLNPLLQNPWMVIHPPIVFLGYAGLAVPFAYAIAALLRRKYDRWAVKALPWALFAWLSLSVGIFIGSYWAYAVLGWGGYWAWDPVENASLVPWLTGTALLHGLLMQKYRKAMGWTSLFLAISTYLLVLYATYLTRSGILADFSVHSFQGLGTDGYLLLGLLSFTLPALGLLFFRWRETGEDKSGEDSTGDKSTSKGFAFFLTILLLGISAGVVALGTSAPALTRLTGNPAAVNSSFYNVTQFPIGVLICGLLGLCRYCSGGEPNG
jgi:cytochrome c-type biogenesis protein CcmF